MSRERPTTFSTGALGVIDLGIFSIPVGAAFAGFATAVFLLRRS